MASPDPIRLLVVEDVPQVAQYIRGLLEAQQQIKLVDLVADGGKALAQIRQLRPDVVIVDVLLQGRVKGPALIDQIRRSETPVPVIALTVPQQPVAVDEAAGIFGVLSMPFSGFDLVHRVQQVHREASEAAKRSGAGLYAIFAPKGGVGKTTIAFNLACALAAAGRRTILVDGSLQFGDLRALLKVPLDAPSIVDLPTDRITEADLADVVWRDPSGIDLLLAPPRVEQAEMITTRDIDKTLSLLRRLYDVVVVDLPTYLSEQSLAFLDAADLVIEIVTYDSTTIHNTILMAETFRAIGYPATKVRYLVNRADSSGGLTPEELARALGREPEYRVVSDGRLVVAANNEGVPFVTSHPEAQISRDIAAIAADLAAGVREPVAARR
jgi:pilus assembly protein CpaE